MELSEARYTMLLRYLDDELSEAEEQLFIKEMAASKLLQQAFDVELMLRQPNTYVAEEIVLSGAATIFEAANDHIKRVQSAVKTGNKRNELMPPKVVHSRRKYQLPAIAAAIIVIASLIFFYNHNRSNSNLSKNIKPAESKTAPADTLIQHYRPPVINEELLAENVSLPKIAAENYSRYEESENDPMETDVYLQYYKQRKFYKVLNATSRDYPTKGTGDDEQQKTLARYLDFYKALSYIETDKPLQAIKLLSRITALEKAGPLYYNSQWYLLLASLKDNDRERTGMVIAKITAHKKSPYYEKAIHIRNLLEKNKP